MVRVIQRSLFGIMVGSIFILGLIMYLNTSRIEEQCDSTATTQGNQHYQGYVIKSLTPDQYKELDKGAFLALQAVPKLFWQVKMNQLGTLFALGIGVGLLLKSFMFRNKTPQSDYIEKLVKDLVEELVEERLASFVNSRRPQPPSMLILTSLSSGGSAEAFIAAREALKEHKVLQNDVKTALEAYYSHPVNKTSPELSEWLKNRAEEVADKGIRWVFVDKGLSQPRHFRSFTNFLVGKKAKNVTVVALTSQGLKGKLVLDKDGDELEEDLELTPSSTVAA